MAERVECPVKSAEQGRTVYCSARICIERYQRREVLPCVALQEARDSRDIIQPMKPISEPANNYFNTIAKILGRLN